MTTTLTHPAAEDLGCFVAGTLKEPERAAIVAHVADCDECRIIVVDATEFGEEPVVAKRSASGRWWMSAAAAIAITVGGVWLVDARRDLLAPLKGSSAHLSSRPVNGRLNGFPYVIFKSMRGAEAGDVDPAAADVEAKASEVLQRRGDDARTQHAKGVSELLVVQVELAARDPNDMSDNAKQELSDLLNDRNAAISRLQSAASGSPDNAVYWSDLATALMARGDRRSLEQARDACDRALRIDKRSADALFNRAKVLELMAETTEAINAYKAYLALDRSSPWAKEARDRVKGLNELKTLL